MKSLLALCTALLTDVGGICSVDPKRDLETLRSRTEDEGLSFLTITLPEFSSDLEQALDRGYVDSNLFKSFKKRSYLPVFLRGFTSQIFSETGVLHDEPSIEAVRALRQVARFFKKLRVPCTDKRVQKAKAKYLETDENLCSDIRSDEHRYDHFLDCCDIVWQSIIGPEFNTFGTVPKHGPGATAERISGNQKFVFRRWHERLEQSFPSTDFAFTSVNHVVCLKHGLDNLEYVSHDDEPPVRVITVPKTLKTPRIIAIEPVCMQYAQQALCEFTVRRVEKNPLTASSVRFTDQSVNQVIALRSSLTQEYSTLDLSEASDRVQSDVVFDMLRAVPHYRDAVFACRSERADLDGTIIHLKKFASMGSAMCFPIESVYFFCIALHSILWAHHVSPSHQRLCKTARWVHVYGDDILVSAHQTDTVIDGLASFHCKLNTTKSFKGLTFRESCGSDGFLGHDVTPVYLRETAPLSRQDANQILSWVDTSNQLFKAGYWNTAQLMKDVVEGIMGELPCVTSTSPGIGWFSFCGYQTEGSCKDLHRPYVSTFTVRVKERSDTIEGYPALLKYFLKRDTPDIVSADKKHLSRSAWLVTIGKKRRRVCPF